MAISGKNFLATSMTMLRRQGEVGSSRSIIRCGNICCWCTVRVRASATDLATHRAPPATSFARSILPEPPEPPCAPHPSISAMWISSRLLCLASSRSTPPSPPPTTSARLGGAGSAHSGRCAIISW